MTTSDWAACERLIGSLAPKFQQEGLELDDLKQEARLAVIESYSTYTPETGVSLNTFLGRRIRDALRKFVAASIDSFELSREWVAESISDGPDSAIKAKSKPECAALREALGSHLYRKPRRVIETSRATVSLDEESGVSTGEDAGSTLHEHIGTGPEQEAVLLLKEAKAQLTVVIGAASKRGGGRLWARVIEMRTQGYSFPQIGVEMGKSEDAVKKLWRRAQKQLTRKRAA